MPLHFWHQIRAKKIISYLNSMLKTTFKCKRACYHCNCSCKPSYFHPTNRRALIRHVTESVMLSFVNVVWGYAWLFVVEVLLWSHFIIVLQLSSDYFMQMDRWKCECWLSQSRKPKETNYSREKEKRTTRQVCCAK